MSRPVSRAWPMLLFYVAGTLLTVKLAATFVLARDGGSLGPFVALLPGLWLDVLLLSLLWWLTWPLRSSPKLWGALPLASATALFSAGSWTSFLVTHTWMTWQRLRGDENVSIGDVGELELSYALPLVGLMAVQLAWVAPAIWLGGKSRLVGALANKRAGLILPATALLLALVNTQTAHLGLYGLSEQPLVVFARSVLVLPEPVSEPLPPKEWKRLHRLTSPYDPGKAPPKLASTPKNLVVFLAEGISTEHTNFGGRYDTTPNVYRRFQDHGLLFDNFYAHTHRSIHAIFSTVCSEYPPPTLDAMTALHPRIDCGSMMETLKTVPGMHQGLFHGGRFSFANKLALLGGRGFEVTLDATDLSNKKKWEETWWGIDDRAVVEAALKFVDQVPEDERFVLFIIPISPHEPYDTPKAAPIPKKVKKSNKDNARFLRAVNYSDFVFEELMKGLEERGRYDDTLSVWVPDHGNYADEPARPTRGKRVLYQHNVHVPLVLLHKPSFSGERSHRIGAQIDFAPTMTAALGAAPDPKDRGQDLLSRSYEPRRVYLLKTRGNDPFVGIVDGEYKFIYDIAPGRWELYDLKEDPEELNNIADAHLARVRNYARDGVRFRKAQRKTLLSVPALVEEHGDEKALLAAAKLTCKGGECPEGTSMELSTCKGKWATTNCLRVTAPKDAPVRVELPGSVVGLYDSIRVRWWNKDKKKIKKVKLRLEYEGRVIRPEKPRWSSDSHRVLPVPHDRSEDGPPVVVTIEAPVDHEPVIEFTEH